MKTFTNTELEYLIAAVQSKFSNARSRHHANESATRALNTLDSEVSRIIRSWAEPEGPTRTLHATVEVSGGVAEVTYADSGIEVTIIDHDNEEVGEEATA